MRFVIGAALASSLLLGAPAYAASAIVTPAIQISAAGTLACWVANASNTNGLEADVEIRAVDGETLVIESVSVAPGGASGISSDDDNARFCVVRVTSGGRKNAIVSLTALQGGVPVAVVAAPR